MIGKGVYDYYPNSLMDLKVPDNPKLIKEVEKRCRGIQQVYKDTEEFSRNFKIADDLLLKADLLKSEIEDLLEDYFEL